MRFAGTWSAVAKALLDRSSGSRNSSRSTSPGVIGGSSAALPALSVIVDDFDVMRVSVLPFETDSVLIIDADTELALPIARKRFQPVSGWDGQICKRYSGSKDCKFLLGGASDPFKPLYPEAMS